MPDVNFHPFSVGNVEDVAASSIVLDMPIIKLVGVNPILRNTNVALDPNEVKMGPRGIMHISGGPADYLMLVEAIEDTDAGTDDQTLPMRALATSIQGPWSLDPSVPVFSAGAGPWKNDEAAPTVLMLSKDGTKLELGFHGGNNSGPRAIGVMTSDNGLTATSWTENPENPLVEKGAAVAFDSAWVADVSGKRLPNGRLVLLYRGYNGTVFRVGRLSGSDWDALVKNAAAVIDIGSVGSWNESHVYGADFFIDVGGRFHCWTAGEKPGSITAMGYYYYSDDEGGTWIQGGNNPVAETGTVAATDADFTSIGDVVNAFPNGDVVVIFYGVSNLNVAYPNNPMRGVGMGVVPLISESPAKLAKFYYPGGNRSLTTVPGHLLNQALFTLCVRFRAFAVNRNTYREIYTEQPAVDKQLFFRIIGGGGADAGKVIFYFRIGATIATLISTDVIDDSEWHDVAVVRRPTPSNLFELWIDGVLHDSVSTDPGVDATKPPVSAIANWHPDSGNPDEPFIGTISDLVIMYSRLTWSEVAAVLASRTYPAGVSAIADFPTDGADNGDVYIVDATPPTPQTL